MSEAKKQCIERLRKVAEHAGCDMSKVSDEEIWAMWWEVNWQE